MREEDAWSQLTAEEQEILAGKLRMAGTATSRQMFNDLVIEISQSDESKTAMVVAGIQNLIDNAGGRSKSAVWQQIEFIDGGWLGENDSMNIVVSVAKPGAFLEVLSRNGYEVDKYYERANLTGGHKHSARFITETSRQPGMHFVQQEGYAEHRFDVHWDRRSAAFAQTGRGSLFTLAAKVIERIAAGLSHNRPISAIEMREELKRMGMS